MGKVAFGIRAIQNGFTVYYIRAATLLEDIKFAVIQISADDATNLFEARNQLSSTIITSS